MEIWKWIDGYSYQVSNYGRVKSIRSGPLVTVPNRILKQQLNSLHGRFSVILCKNHTYKRHNVHRLVAIAFLIKPDNKNIVNHLDGNPKNNHVSNLEWCTQSENVMHGFNRRGGTWKEQWIKVAKNRRGKSPEHWNYKK